MNAPRIRGRTAQIETPIEDAGKWVYELSLSDFTGEVPYGKPLLYGPFDTEEIAKEVGREIVKMAAETVEIELTGKVSGKYFDLKNGGVMRPWKDNS